MSKHGGGGTDVRQCAGVFVHGLARGPEEIRSLRVAGDGTDLGFTRLPEPGVPGEPRRSAGLRALPPPVRVLSIRRGITLNHPLILIVK